MYKIVGFRAWIYLCKKQVRVLFPWPFPARLQVIHSLIHVCPLSVPSTCIYVFFYILYFCISTFCICIWACKSFILWYMPIIASPNLYFVFILKVFAFQILFCIYNSTCELCIFSWCFLSGWNMMQNVLSINIMFLLRRGNERQYFIPPLEIALFSGHNCTDGCQTAGADPGDWNCPLIWLGSAGWPPIVWESESHRIILSWSL